jgi:hypothetical protein
MWSCVLPPSDDCLALDIIYRAIRTLENAVQLIQSVPVILIFPPPPAQTTIPSQTLLGVQDNLRRAELFLVLAAVLA